MEKIEDIVPFGLRMRAGLKRRLEEDVHWKKENLDRRWSLNYEIVDRLERSYDPPRDIKSFSSDELIAELRRRFGQDAVTVSISIEKPGAVSDG